jgi:hypothetical protein
MIKYQVEEDFLCGGWENVETDGDGNKVYYDTEQEAQDNINPFVKESNSVVDNGNKEHGDHYVDYNFRVVKMEVK